ncbi:OpgC domain-containing protein [Pseudoalteromonas sp. NBT06-2]|uniref:OpgC domain-containing protein n=1 Tax=Pseudoalteromonas sp. NBT06-2 TaxID=2025950 RepID=UPI001481E7A2|nr:OpgC domain-containing protein [Pseudoalteromonas sp. NBT06-2]
MHYQVNKEKRDLRIDFIRGVVMVILLLVHLEIFSWFNFIVWERIGLISGAEGFVIVSGYVLGLVHKKINLKTGFKSSALRLFERSAQLYKINLFIVVIIIALSALPFIDLTVITTFKNWSNGQVYELFPNRNEIWYRTIANILLLRNSPHQIQILGLYCILLLGTPIAIWLFNQGKAKWVCAICIIIYFFNMSYPIRITQAQFEYAFPLLSWQILYIFGLTFGYFKEEITLKLSSKNYHYIVFFSGLMTFGFMLLAWNSPNNAFPPNVNLGWIEANTFNDLHYRFFDKSKLGILRLVNYACFLTFIYWCLTYFWRPIKIIFGWLLIPLGQASLYVFIMHLLFIVMVEAITQFSDVKPTFQASSIWFNTLLHASCIFGLWVMVKKKVLFKYVPR